MARYRMYAEGEELPGDLARGSEAEQAEYRRLCAVWCNPDSSRQQRERAESQIQQLVDRIRRRLYRREEPVVANDANESQRLEAAVRRRRAKA